MKKQQKTKIFLEKSITEILAIGDKDLRPYIEIVNFSGKNILERPLGNLLGILEIKDEEEDSAYIVNFLSSVARKEYFINYRRTATESFESALNKINLALSKIAKEGNTHWIGKLDAVICALENNSIHFSVSGKAKILLLRDGVLSDISQGLSPEPNEISPLKTFLNISEGKIKNQDKFILAGEELFYLFSFSDLEKKSKRMSTEEFSQMIKTAFKNKLDIGAALIIDIQEKIEKPKPVQKSSKQVKLSSIGKFNAFASNTFEKNYFSQKNSDATIIKSATKDNTASTNSSAPENRQIFIQGKSFSEKDSGKGKIYLLKIQNYLNGKKENINKVFNRQYFFKQKTIAFLKQNLPLWKKQREPNKKNDKNKNPEVAKKFIFSKIFLFKAFTLKKPQTDFSNKFFSGVFHLKKLFFSWKKISSDIFLSRSDRLKSIPLNSKEKNKDTSFIPQISSFKKNFQNLTHAQKLYALGIIPAILIILYFGIKIISRSIQKNTIEQKMETEVVLENPSSLKASIFFSEEIAQNLFFADNYFWAITKDKIIQLRENGDKKNEFALPKDFGKTKESAYMEDLRLIFLLTDRGKIISFSVINKKFQENSIEIPAEANIEKISAYLTYIYLFDSAGGKIYRYPRAEGGFGTKTEWLKENADFSSLQSVAIDGNIYLVTGGKVIKFFAGKKDAPIAENSSFSQIFTTKESSAVYLWNETNPSLFILSKNDSALKEYPVNLNLREKKIFKLFAEEKKKEIFLVAENEIWKIKLEN